MRRIVIEFILMVVIAIAVYLVLVELVGRWLLPNIF